MTSTPFQFVPTMRRVEKAAWNAIRRCAKAKKITTLPLPVPIEQWVEGPLKIRLGIADLSDRNADGGLEVLGCANPRERAILISQTLQNQEARFRFTLAHELGHVLLHSKVSPEFRDTSEAEFLDERFEREANRFAAAFLMPIPALSTEYEKLAVEHWGEPEALLKAVTQADAVACRVLRSMVFPTLSRTFGTSLSATIRRFADVRLPCGDWALSNQAAKSFFPPPSVQVALFQPR